MKTSHIVCLSIFTVLILWILTRSSKDSFTSGSPGDSCKTNYDCISGQCEGTAIIPGENPAWARNGPLQNTGYGVCN